MKKKSKVTLLSREEVLNKMSYIAGELQTLAKTAKKKFDRADIRTKKTIIGGIAGALAILAATAGVKGVARRKKSK